MDRDSRENFRQNILNFLGDREVWAFHPECEYIAVSNFGQVRNIITGTIYKNLYNSNGYCMVNVHTFYGRRCKMVHRLVCETFLPYLGAETANFETNHIDGNKTNNCLTNLEWLTRQENLDHARENGLFKGRTCQRKLKKCDYSDIIEFWNLGFTQKALAKSYGISPRYVSDIIKRKDKYVKPNDL